MHGTIWTKKMTKFLVDNYGTMINTEIAKRLKLPNKNCVGSRLKRLNLSRTEAQRIALQTELNSSQERCYKWTPKKEQFLIDNINLIPSKRMANMLGCIDIVIRTKRKRLGLHPTPKAIEKFRIESQFDKGHTPWNFGIKGMHYSPATEFKKGHKPVNTLYDGAITTRQNYKRGITMQYIRISENNWIELQKYLWMQHYGPIPKKHVIRFKNGDTMDVRIENIECISMAENANRNHNPDTDKCIAANISRDPVVKKELLNRPEILDLKREQLKLRRTINDRLDGKT